MHRHALALLVASSLAACGVESGTLGPDAPGGQAHILLGVRQGAAIRASVLASQAPPVDFSAVTSLELTFDRIEAHRVGGGAWVPLSIEALTVDFAALDAGPVELAGGDLPAGDYDNLRIFPSAVTVTFATDIMVGNATFLAGQSYDVEIPGSQNTGLKIPTAHFTMDGTAESVLLLFDPSATTPSIGTTGDGRVRMTPVLHEADEATEASAADEEQPAEEEPASEEGSQEDGGSGSASILIGATGGVAGAVTFGDGVGLAGSVVPGAGVSDEDIASLRLVLCEIRAIRRGDDEEAATTDESDTDTSTEGETPSASEQPTEGDAEADAAPACLGNEGGAAWTRIPLEATEIDLFALAEGEFAEVAVGELPVGSYHNVRLYIAEAWITFVDDITIGNRTYEGGVEHPLTIPSASQNGLRIPTSHFDVDAESDGMLALVFDRTSVSSIKVIGNGIRMSPILRETDQATEEGLGDETGVSEGDGTETTGGDGTSG